MSTQLARSNIVTIVDFGRDPACASVVAALEDDPFYRSICAGQANYARRRAVLSQYFHYSIQEGTDIGRCIHLEDPALGVAVWLLPQDDQAAARASTKKRAFLTDALSAEGCANYYRMVNFMSVKARGIVDEKAWYLSIVAVDPSLQGRGLGRRLLEPTLAEADDAHATCYLETFSLRNLSFYERLGFSTRSRFTEPVTEAEYAVMVR